MRYQILKGTVRSGGNEYGVGAEVELPEDEAESLLEDGVIAPSRNLFGRLPAGMVVIDDGALVLAGDFEAEDDEPAIIPAGGITLTEAYRQFVETNPVSQTLFRVFERMEPGWEQLFKDWPPGYVQARLPNAARKVNLGSWTFVISACFERWSCLRRQSFEAARRGMGWGGDHDEQENCVPQIVVQAQERRQQLTASLIKKFRNEELVAEGICEHPEPRVDLRRERIAPDWWSRNDLLIGFKANALFRTVGDAPVLFISDVRVLPGENVAEVASTIGAETQCKKWLQGLMMAGSKAKAKPEYWKDAEGKFEGLSRRGFDRAWAQALEINPTWGKAGHPKKKMP